MKSTLKTLLLALPGFEAFCRSMTRDHVRAIMYHRFAPSDAHHRLGSASFRRQLSLISAHHPVVGPDDHLAVLRGEDRGHCPVVLTVDDGYRDFLDHAFPLLTEFGMGATFFVTTGFVSGQTWFWWDKIEHVCFTTTREDLVLEMSGDRLELRFTTRQERRDAWNRVADRCRFLPDRAKEQLVARLAESAGVILPESAPEAFGSVSWDEIRRMAQGGVAFGAHTLTHPILSRVDFSVAVAEIDGSADVLAAELGKPVTWFCYPQGGPADSTPEIRDVVRRRFAGCYLAYQDMTTPPDTAALPRYVASGNEQDFRWMLCGAEYLFLKLKKALGRPTGVGAGYWEGSV